MKIKPTQNKILVKPIINQSTTSSGILISETAKTDEMTAQIISIDKDLAKEWGIKQGDTILHRIHAGDEIEFEGETYLIIDPEEILAVFNAKADT